MSFGFNRVLSPRPIPADVARDRSRVERFEREARAAAALNHPNVCVIFEIGRHEGDPFIAMEVLEGRTLRDVIGARHRGDPLPLETIIEIALPLPSEQMDARIVPSVRRFLSTGLAREPDYAPAYAGIADIWAAPPYTGLISPMVAIPKAKAAVQKARSGTPLTSAPETPGGTAGWVTRWPAKGGWPTA